MDLASRRIFTVILLATVLVLTNCRQDATGKMAGKQTENAGETPADPAITAQIAAAFAKAPQLKALPIEVTTRGGVVRLSRIINSQKSVDRAEEIAGSIRGSEVGEQSSYGQGLLNLGDKNPHYLTGETV
jgi:osmotically-inducible protein OsmY